MLYEHARNLRSEPSRVTRPPEKADPRSSYEFRGKLSEGAYGSVYLARIKGTEEQVAIKKIKTDKLDSPSCEGVSATTIREISILKELHHRNVVRLIEVIVDKRVWLVFELGTGDLRSHLQDLEIFPGDVPQDTVMDYTFQILTAIDFCHSLRIIHRDLKPQNVLIGRDGLLKVADFGLGRTVTMPIQKILTHEVVTLWYRAPEIVLGGDHGAYSFAIDVFSVGCIMSEIATKKPLFPSESEIDHVKKIFALNGTPTTDSWPNFETMPMYESTQQFPHYSGKNYSDIQIQTRHPQLNSTGCALLKALVANCPIGRPSAKAALQHPFFIEEDVQYMTQDDPNDIQRSEGRRCKRKLFKAASISEHASADDIALLKACERIEQRFSTSSTQR